MIAMRPIREYDVIDLLNNGRFEGEVEGYVVMDGPSASREKWRDMS